MTRQEWIARRNAQALGVAGLTITMAAAPCVCDTIHMPADQPTIQVGLDATVTSDTVIVADGACTGDGNRDIDFGGKAVTLVSEHGAANCIIDCQASEIDQCRSDN